MPDLENTSTLKSKFQKKSELFEKLKNLKVKKRHVSEKLIRSLPSEEDDFMLYDQEPVGSEPSIFLEHRTDLPYQLNRLKASKLYFTRIKSVATICKILNAHGDTFDEKMNLLREMHQSLPLKRKVMEALKSEEVSRKQLKKRVKSRHIVDNFYFNFKNIFAKLSHSIYLIYPHINQPIKVYFGSEVVSFFTFCWWFFCMNLFNTIIIILFMVIPQHIYNRNENDTNIFAEIREFSLFNILTGKHWFTNSTFYYAGYTHRTFEIIPGIFYNMPMAFILTISMVLLTNFFVIAHTFISHFGKQSFSVDDEKYIFSKVVFSHWDYATGVQAVADFMKSTFYEEMQGLLQKDVPKEVKPIANKVYKIGVFLVINFLVFMFMAGCCTAMFILLYLQNLRSYYSLVVSTMLTLVPILFYYFLKFIESYESYLTEKLMLCVSMIRLLVLRIVLMGIVFYFWVDVFENKANTCYQTELSASLFRLVVGNFCVQIFIYSLTLEYLKRKLIDIFGFAYIKSTFDLPYHAVDILHYQFLGWVGLMWVPLLPLLNSVLLYILLYLKANSILENCIPTKTAWSSEEANKFLLLLTSVTFITSVIFSTVALLRMGDSSCGPFNVWTVKIKLVERVLLWKPYTIPYYRTFSLYVWSPMILFIFFISFCAIVAAIRSYALSKIALTKSLEEELRLNLADNAFLLHGIDEILKHSSEQKKSESETSIDSSCTNSCSTDEN